MDAYTAVHSQEAKEELNSQRDLISEMNTARLKDDDLRNIAEEVLEVVLEEVSVSEAEDIISNMVPESSIVGRQEKVQRILEAFGETFSRIKLKNKEQALEEFVKYRQQKRLSETWSTRHNQDKRVQRLHSTVVAEDSAIIKNGLLKMFNEKKSDPCWDSHKQVGMKKKGGKMVPNCVPKNEEVEVVDEAEKPYPYGKVGDKLRKVAGERDAETDLKKKNKLASRFSKIKREYDLPEAKAKMKKEEASMSPQEIQLQKKKAMLDRMIAQKRQQGLNKVKKSEAPAKAMGEEAECAHSMKGKECPIHGKKDCSSMSEEASDAMKDRRMERGGVGGNQRYNKPVSNTPNTFGKKKPKYDGMSALERVKADIRAKHGQGAIKEDAKMAKQSDEKLAALHKQVSSSDQSLPSNQFMMKRVTKEMNRRKKAT